MSEWLAGCMERESYTEFDKSWGIDPPIEFTKPCHILKYCPYGQLVEAFPLEVPRSIISCRVFGHDCPVFRCAEPLAEEFND